MKPDLIDAAAVERELSRWSFMPGWQFELALAAPPWPALAVLVHATFPDVRNPAETVTITQRNIIQPYIADDPYMFAGFLRSIVQTMLLHEADEWLRRDGVAPFDPHKDQT